MAGSGPGTVVWHENTVSRAERERITRARGTTVWLTGLPSSGKSTVACALARALQDRGVLSVILDGDNIRHGLNSNLGFSPEDRTENIRRISEVAKLLTSFGMVNVVAFISPYAADRLRAREIQEEGDFLEVFVDVPLEVAESRDPKGMYRKAREGIIREFTGISAPYEAPVSPDIHLRTDRMSAGECAAEIMERLAALGRLLPGDD
jgi:adenylylsulfate kinase